MENKSKKNKAIVITTLVVVLFFASMYLVYRNFISTAYAAIEFPVNKSIIFTAKISNKGTLSTVIGFDNYFQIASAPNGGGTITEEPGIFMAPLSSNSSDTISTTHVFKSTGTYSIRACADKTNTIIEISKSNNCGAWINISIVDSSSLPTTGDTCTNGADNPTDNPPCTTINGSCINGATNPPECTNPTIVIPPEVNKCLLIEQNPLTFTPDEKARLTILLRRFYLISSTLKTTEDITTIYNEIDQQKNFISQIEELTQQCYAQVNMSANPEWVRHGNPWYKNESGGTFPYTSGDTGYYPNPTAEESFTERILNIW